MSIFELFVIRSQIENLKNLHIYDFMHEQWQSLVFYGVGDKTKLRCLIFSRKVEVTYLKEKKKDRKLQALWKALEKPQDFWKSHLLKTSPNFLEKSASLKIQVLSEKKLIILLKALIPLKK